jgi:AbrB family looped-hinge helix DNA binding protein
MEIVKISPKYQVVIPQSVREALEIYPGEKIHVLQYENRIEFIPEKNIKSMRGFLKGIDTTIERDKDRI